MNAGTLQNLSARQEVADGPARVSGLEAIGDVSWGTHFCLLYSARAELLETLAPYFEQGLAANEFCMWVASDSFTAAEAKDALRRRVPGLDDFLAKGQIEILDHDEWFVSDGRFDPERVIQGWADKLETALERGFDGVRLAASTYWLTNEDWQAFTRYETIVDRIIASKPILALCTYSLEKWSMREIFDAIAIHDFALIKEDNRWRAFKSFARQRMEQGLKESEARLRATIEGVNDGIITADETGAMLSINPAATRMFGYPPYEMIGENVGMLLPEPTRRVQLSDYFKTSGRVVARARESKARRQDGALFPVEWTITDVQYEDQQLFVIVVRDLTERRETEARMQKLQASRLNAMGGLATGLAHEINQPLSATATYLKAARRLLHMPPEARPASIDEVLENAAAQVMRAGHIISHLREFIMRGEPDKTLLSLHELIEEAHSATIAGAREASVSVFLRLAAKNDRVLADKVQIKQVLVNLIRNAVEAMQTSAERELIVSTFVDDDAIRIEVADSGPGLSEVVKANLFEPFKTTKAGGMGVGLTISRAIVEAHYGMIWADSVPGGGTTFSFTLPVTEAAQEPNEKVSSAPVKSVEPVADPIVKTENSVVALEITN